MSFRSLTSPAWLAALGAALAAVLTACPESNVAPVASGRTQLVAPDAGTLKVRAIYDFTGDRSGTEYASFERNGAYDWPEPIVGGWPVRITPIDGTPGSAVVVETERELSPTGGRYVSLPAGRYRVEALMPAGGPSNPPGRPYWVNTGANATQAGVTTRFAAGTTSLEVNVAAGSDHASAAVARFFMVCETYFYAGTTTTKLYQTYAPSGFPASFEDDVKSGAGNTSYTCRPDFGG